MGTPVDPLEVLAERAANAMNQTHPDQGRLGWLWEDRKRAALLALQYAKETPGDPLVNRANDLANAWATERGEKIGGMLWEQFRDGALSALRIVGGQNDG